MNKIDDIAKDIAEYWKHNCSDDDYYYKVRDDVYNRVNQEEITNNEANTILDLITNIYAQDSWKALEFFNGSYNIIIQYNTLIINDISIKNVWEAVLSDNNIILYDMAEEEIGRVNIFNVENIKIIEDK